MESRGEYADEDVEQQTGKKLEEIVLTEQFAAKVEQIVEKLEHIFVEDEKERGIFTTIVPTTILQQIAGEEKPEHIPTSSPNEIVGKLERIVEQLEQIVVEKEEQKDEVLLTTPTTTVETVEQKITAQQQKITAQLVEKKIEEVVVETREVKVVEKEGEATIIIEVELRKQEEVSGLEIDLLVNAYDSNATTALRSLKKKSVEETKEEIATTEQFVGRQEILVTKDEQKDKVTLAAPTTTVETVEQKVTAPVPEEKPAPESEKAPELVEKKV
ncbi:hypothetical protein Y032_0298g1743, partial [Ancylostoma ceylanicum]